MLPVDTIEAAANPNATAKAGRAIRWRRLFLLGMATAVVVSSAIAIPAIFGMILSVYDLWMPSPIRPWVRVGSVILLGWIFAKEPSRIGRLAIPNEFWNGVQAFSARATDRYLSVVLIGLTVLMLSLWLPHYFNWPWWADQDHFSLAAHSWDAGRLPYRDQLDFNFPGPMFLMWGLGKTFGWDRTMPAYVVDALMLVGLGLAMTAWSRSRFGRSLPGLAGYTAFVAYYLALDISLVAQRDWQSTWLVVFSLMAIESLAVRQRQVWCIAAFLVALAFTIRPYPILFLPAFVSAIDGRVRQAGESPWISVKALAWFALIFGVMLAVVYSPLWIAGILDDFVRSLGYVVPGGAYNQNSANGFRSKWIVQWGDWRVIWLIVPLGLLALQRCDKLGRSARTWSLAIVGATFYAPIGPVPHHYLIIPIQVLLSFGLAVVLGAILNLRPDVKPTTRVLAVLVWLGWFYPGVPRYCLWTETVEALALDFFGTPLKTHPIVLDGSLRTRNASPYHYSWEDYNDLILYLKQRTKPTTLVANSFRKNPHPAINGPSGRLSPYPSAANVLWFRWVGTGREPDFCASLARDDAAHEDAVVVWTPGEKTDFDWMQLRPIVDTIRRHYRPEAHFGVMEVWRRIPKGTTPEPLPPYLPESLEILKARGVLPKSAQAPSPDRHGTEPPRGHRVDP